MANNAAPPAPPQQQAPVIPLYLTAMESPIALVELMSRADWASSIDPNNWLESELRTILFAKDIPDSSYLLFQLGPRTGTLWRPPGDLMTITGGFACLPPETIWRILDNLDFGSLTHFSRTCRYLRAVTKQSPTLNLLMRVIPKLRKILKTTGLIYRHSMNNIMAELCHPRCRYCDDHAVSLYLATCERVCYNCQMSLKELALVPIICCEKVLHLSPSSLRRLPVLLTEKSTFRRDTYPASEIIPDFLTPLKCAVEEAVRCHGGMDELMLAMGHTHFDAISPWASWDAPMFIIFTAIRHEIEQAGLVTSDLPQPALPDFLPAESLCSHALTTIPYLVRESEPAPMRGFCRGCTEVLRLPYIAHSYFEGYMNMPFISPIETQRALLKRARRCLDWSEMCPQHLRECIGAQMLMFQFFTTRTVPPRVEERS